MQNLPLLHIIQYRKSIVKKHFVGFGLLPENLESQFLDPKGNPLKGKELLKNPLSFDTSQVVYMRLLGDSKIMEFTIGDKVQFGRKGGMQTLGEVVKVNPRW
jgi:hypothetical protein